MAKRYVVGVGDCTVIMASVSSYNSNHVTICSGLASIYIAHIWGEMPDVCVILEVM